MKFGPTQLYAPARPDKWLMGDDVARSSPLSMVMRPAKGIEVFFFSGTNCPLAFLSPLKAATNIPYHHNPSQACRSRTTTSPFLPSVENKPRETG